MQLRPNVNGKVEVGLLAPRGVVLRFAVVLSWAAAETDRSQVLRLKEQGRFEGMHYFQGGWIREGVAYSSAMQNTLNPVIAVTFCSVEWAGEAAVLANRLELFRAQRDEERKEERQKLEALKAVAESEMAARVAAVGKLEALLAHRETRESMHETEAWPKAQALRDEIARLRVVHEAEVRDLRAEISRLRGEIPSLQQLDFSKLEELLTVVTGTQERAWKRLRRMHLQERMCVVCSECEADAVMNACGHLIACAACAEKLALCPVCRRPSPGFTRIFR